VSAGAAPDDVIATVNGRRVTVEKYQRAYNAQVDDLRRRYGGNLDSQMIKQLGIPQQLIQRLVDEEMMMAEADRLGITVTDGEVRERLIRLPAFQENGQFIGEARYRQILDMQRPPITPPEFEAQMRRSLTIEKLQGAISDWMQVSDEEVDREYRRRNEKVKLDLALFQSKDFQKGVTTTDADLTAQFNASPDAYKIPEKRRVRYIAIDAEHLRASMTATQQEIEAKYQQNAKTYSTPEQVRASHILLKTEGKDDATVKKAAEDILKKVKAGGDFAALAKQYSEDEGSKANGGDLDYNGRGVMYKEFEDAAWALKPGEISGLVKTQAGYHIIKMVDKKAAVTKTIADVRPQLEDQVKLEKAQAEAAKLAQQITPEIKGPDDLDRVAKAHGWTVGDSGLFTREEPLAGMGFAPAVANQAFALEQGKVAGPLQTTNGFAFIALAEIKPSYLPKLDEVKEKVRQDVVKTKAIELAKTKAATVSSAKGNFEAAVKAAGGTLKTTDFIARNSPLPEIGVNQAVDDAAFTLKPGGTSAPISTDSAVVVVHLKEKQDLPTAQADTTSLREELRQQHQQEFFAAYMAKARPKLTVKLNERALQLLMDTAK
jgi:peptidyl-prolyl cis-trans isomerase D